jgi:pimeloyl-ACP methyl ester carboxylesterase
MDERIGDLWLEHWPPPSAGRGRLLLVHGMWGGSWYWRPWLARFADGGWDTWAVNLRGHHGSGPATRVGQAGLADYVGDLHACARALGDVAVVGHSMGGLLALALAGTAAVRAAVLLTSAPPRGILALRGPVLARLPRYVAALLGSRPFLLRRADADALLFNNLAPELRADAYARLVPESGRAARELALGRVAVAPARVRCPVLVVGAGRDAITPPAIQRAIAARYRAEYQEWPGHAHMLMLEAGGAGVADAIVAWLARAAP